VAAQDVRVEVVGIMVDDGCPAVFFDSD
jgi:hypothetical protein